jgi:uncharacterized membrane protein
MFQVALAATIPVIAWLLPIAIVLPVDAIVLGSLLLLATRARRAITESGFPPGMYGERGNRRHWKYGFYVNPDDPRLWVPRPQRPQSRTINMGHPKGLATLAAFTGALMLLPLVILAIVGVVLLITLP